MDLFPESLDIELAARIAGWARGSDLPAEKYPKPFGESRKRRFERAYDHYGGQEEEEEFNNRLTRLILEKAAHDFHSSILNAAVVS